MLLSSCNNNKDRKCLPNDLIIYSELNSQWTQNKYAIPKQMANKII